jgi:hypothetical protein
LPSGKKVKIFSSWAFASSNEAALIAGTISIGVIVT